MILYSLNNDEDRGRGSQRSTRRALTLQYSTGDDVQRRNDAAAAADDDDDDDDDDDMMMLIMTTT